MSKNLNNEVLTPRNLLDVLNIITATLKDIESGKVNNEDAKLILKGAAEYSQIIRTQTEHNKMAHTSKSIPFATY